MAKRLLKEVIRPGTYWYTDDDGKPAKLVATPQLISHWHKSGNEMLQDGLYVPVPLEHQLDAVPKTKAQLAADELRNNAGSVYRYVMQPGHKLYAAVDIEDPDIEKKIPATIKFTSPRFSSFLDGNGKQWDGVISHLALTSRPRIVKQDPFPSIAAAMSLVPTLPNVAVNANVSLAGLVEKHGDAWLPANEAAFSMWSGAKFDIGDLPEAKKKAEKKPDEGETAEEPAPEEASEEGGEKKPTSKIPTQDASEPHAVTPEDAGALIDNEGNISIYKVIADLLPGVGLDLGDGTDEDFMERLYKACIDWKSKESDMAEQNPNNPGPNKNDTLPNPIVQEHQPAYTMSLEQVNAIADPALKATAQMAVAVVKRQLADATTARTARVEKLAKKLPAAQRDKLLSLTNVQLSLSADGAIVDPSAKMLDLLEATAVDVPAQLSMRGGNGVQLSGVAQPHPHQWGEELSPERAEAVANEFMGNVGMKPRTGAMTEDEQTALALKLLRRQSA